MAIKRVEIVTCDVTGADVTDDYTTEKFSIGRKPRKSDIGPDGAVKFWEAMNFLLEHSQPDGADDDDAPRERTRKTRTESAVHVDPVRLRKWCEEFSVEISSHGRPSPEAVKAYLHAWLMGSVPAEYR
jgi:hypothetical protein